MVILVKLRISVFTIIIQMQIKLEIVLFFYLEHFLNFKCIT